MVVSPNEVTECSLEIRPYFNEMSLAFASDSKDQPAISLPL